MRVRTVWIGAALASAVAMAGCGSSSSSSQSATTSASARSATTSAKTSAGSQPGTTSTPAADPQVQAARQQTAIYQQVRSNGEIPKLGKTPPKNLRIAILTCPLPACQQTTAGAVSGAKALGWKIDYVTYQLTPTAYQQAFSNLANNPPNAVAFISAFPDSTIAPSLAKLHAAGTRIVVLSPQVPVKPSAQIAAVLQGPPEFSQGGVVAANAVVADAGGKTTAAVVTDPAYGVFAPTTAAFKSTMAKLCPSCGVDVLHISLANPAAQNAAAVVNYLRQHPDVKYLFFVIGDAVSGVPGALASAGLTGTKIISFTPDLSNLADVASGSEWATIQDENGTSGWRAVDAIARLAVGENVGPESDPAGYVRLLTKANVIQGKLPATPGTPSQFLAAWGVSSGGR